MRAELRRTKNGLCYYSFLYLDKTSGKRVRLTRDYVRTRFGRDIVDAADAALAVKLLDAEYETLRIRLQKRASWEKEFYNFKGLLESYRIKQKKRAPNSYKNNVHYLKHYVLHYFLVVARCNSVDFWPELYEQFREWLERDAKLVKQPGKPISYGAKNHCIKALNTFMRQLYEEKVLTRLVLCPKFASHLLNERTIDDVITEEEMERIYVCLRKAEHQIEAVFYRMLYFTGLRFNEGLGVSLDDLHIGQVQHEYLRRLLDRHGIAYQGYLVISSQPDHETRGLRGLDGHIRRKPLKGRKKITEKSARVIAICDDTLWTDLVELYNSQVDAFARNQWGRSPSDYALSTRSTKLPLVGDCKLRTTNWG